MANIFGTDDDEVGALDDLAHKADVQGGLPSAIPVLSAETRAIREMVGTSLPQPPWHDPRTTVTIYGAPTPPGPGGWPPVEPWTPPAPPFMPLQVDAPPPYADAEVAALATIAAALQGLNEAARKRVLRYLAAKYGAE